MSLRNRSVVTLPSDRDPVTKEFDYTIDYLESQMRGADFERYMSRLDEEMSLGIFTPILLFRTADVGSYNLGVQQQQLFMFMLNALAGDLKEYIDRYVVEKLKAINFTPNAPRAEWVFRKMGKENVETVRAVLTELVRGERAKPDLEELGAIVGLKLSEVKQVLADPEGDPADPEDPDEPDQDKRGQRNRGTDDKGPKPAGEARATSRAISNRIRSQVENAWKARTFGPGFEPDPGHRRRLGEAFRADGMEEGQSTAAVDKFFGTLDTRMKTMISFGVEEYAGPSDFMSMLDRVLDELII